MASAPSGPPSSGSAFRAAGSDPTQIALAGVPALEVGVATDPGRMPEKQVNEDAALARSTRFGHLAVVCDGMGGHVGGREASHIAIESIFRVMDSTPTGLPADVLAAAIREANAAIFARGNQLPELKGMGSTCVAVLTHAMGTEVAHVGDSRVYLMTQQQVFQVTKDHSLVQRLVDANMLTPDEAMNHPSANQITNALGMKPDVEVEVRPQALPNGPGDVFVLCSDGLSDEIGPQDLLNILAPHPPVAQAAQSMVDLANARGGHDNITVIVARLAGGAPFVPAMQGSAHPTPVGQAPTTTLEMAVPAEAQQAQQALQAQHAVQAAAAPGAISATGMPVGKLAPMQPSPPQAGPSPIAATQLGAPQPVPQFSPPPAFVAQSHVLEGEQPPSLREAPPRRGGGGAVIFIALLLVLGAIGGGVYWFVLRDHHPTTPPTTTSSTAEEEPETTATPKKPDKTKPKPITTETEPSASETNVAPSASSSAPPKKPPPGFQPKPPSTVKTSDTVKDPGPTGGPPKHPDNELPPEMQP